MTVKDAVKESLVGSSTDQSQPSHQAKTNFLRHARKDEGTEDLYMTEDDFINAIAPKHEDYHKIKREHYGILFKVADRKQTGKLSLSDWATFENLLSKPDAEYEIAFRLFDTDGTGTVKWDTFKNLYNVNKDKDSIPFDWNSEWASLYTGRTKSRHDMTYPQFAQMLRGLQGERIRQAFHIFDKDGDGYIEPEDFQRIILETSKHKLSDYVLEHLPSLCNISTGTKISYATVRAFQNIMREMDMIDVIVREATQKSDDGKITRADFLNEAARITRFSLFTPMEADILFHFAGLDAPSGRLAQKDFAKVIDASWRMPLAIAGQAAVSTAHKAADKTKSLLYNVLESVHHFALGSLAGAFGAFMVYPIDLVKTRMQNQRSTRVGERLYNNSLDCARKVIRNEGFTGLYSGVVPQLIGVAPEKAIKLTVNDLVRGHFTNKENGKIWYPYEILAGGTAGGCQVIFTNPLEIVKIRLQVQGEIAKNVEGAPRRSALWIVKNLGLVGLYKGASACLLRDVPFSAIYFPTYAHLKSDFFGESPTHKLGVVQLLTAGAIAGMPAAYLTTPCDVIKTRLQVEARKGEVGYTGLRHCAQTILKEEGFKAFFKGGPARIIRSSPQFGFTLASYELLQKWLPMPGHEEVTPSGQIEPGVGLQGAKAPLPYLRSRNALKLILDLDENIGRVKIPQADKWPKFMQTPSTN
ncbi:mitochondrial carrier domain-containing protein [Aspergillus caelatus]|uniref:Mitochondrial aspartate-glutamate transporter AGC1 n=2 Tax=Aspergillus subgen. Circumdati TaxID=2720871 RepID=A0A5N6ZLR5_9EURO|nr:mitochondrial carrier domain-containing protein [Aspergillus caelatus]KAE8358547.1 mitochondrial carrier domain-containing protein [Aspergillus caelatus]KAE8415971.1 mitochondrial carrier domain-containing protein [Aspergillus pseudocaelatus]